MTEDLKAIVIISVLIATVVAAVLFLGPEEPKPSAEKCREGFISLRSGADKVCVSGYIIKGEK